MLLRTTRMRTVHIDPAARTARAEADAVWPDVTVPAAQHGLAALAGSSTTVGVTGYTLGGGLGWLARRYGLAANSVTAAELVTPDGDLVRADADHEPDLFWAVRGGGGIGVVTAARDAVVPGPRPVRREPVLPDPARRGGAGRLARVDRHGAGRGLLPGPPSAAAAGAAAPEPLRGRAFVKVEAAYLGDAGTGAELTQPLRRLGPELDTFATIPPPALGQLHMDPDQPVPFQGPARSCPTSPPPRSMPWSGWPARTPTRC